MVELVEWIWNRSLLDEDFLSVDLSLENTYGWANLKSVNQEQE